jgi:hypothetical protein
MEHVVGLLDIAASQEDEQPVAGIDDDGVSQIANPQPPSPHGVVSHARAPQSV